MALFKLNKLQLNLADDEGWRLDIETLPELAKVILDYESQDYFDSIISVIVCFLIRVVIFVNSMSGYFGKFSTQKIAAVILWFQFLNKWLYRADSSDLLYF